MLESYLAVPPMLGVLGLLVALGIYLVVTRFPEGDESVKKIGDQIHLGAMTFMKTEYTYLSIFALIVIVLVWFSLGEGTAIAVFAGALSSSVAGWIGMYSATKANVRTATAASDSGAEAALSVAFYGGSIMGLCVASLGLIGLTSIPLDYALGEEIPIFLRRNNVRKLSCCTTNAWCFGLISRFGHISSCY